MSDETVTVAREAFTAMIDAIGSGSAGQEAWGAAYLDPSVEWREDPGLPGATVHRGRAAAVAGVRDFSETLGIVDGRIEDVVGGDDAAVVLALAIGRSPKGEVPTEYRWGFVVRARAGKVCFVRAYLDQAEALRAAGSEAPR